MKKELCNGLCELTNDEMMEVDGGSVVAVSATPYDPLGGWSLFDGLYNSLLRKLIWTPAYINLKRYYDSIDGVEQA